MCGHRVYWDFNLCTFFSPFTKNIAIILFCLLFSPKDISVAGIKVETAYKTNDFHVFSEYSEGKGRGIFSWEKGKVK